ncbi:ATP-binding cassette domain-containing protein [Parasulfuritortus cantonensis]|uniref:ATP-binding cassette domain-containing protein n=1 Tax=Parasulfuritortus cantonensis TaxID=2528202 RepID=A0A4R1B1M6_9PROT|nr:ATP-binding cassette domain-containing protein [Parasulfuritortus cantonensis]TCJ11932.1 ATP-binding cassette domain-containing protein [Parasulfuritortus cantonensis]
MTAPLVLTNLTKRYGATAVVDGVSLSIRAGQCHGLLGPNGAGKTTTLRLALGLIAADAGDIRLLGEPMPAGARRARARVGVVPQTDSLDPDFTVRENLLAYGRYFGLKPAEVEARVPDLLDFAGLAGKADATVPSLSGGMKRRLTLARALINDPDLVVLDEPTTGLDPQARHLVWQGLRRLTARGKTLLLTTHFMDEAERLCDVISIIDRGRIIAEGSPRALIAEHIEPQVVEIFGDTLADWRDCALDYCQRCERAGESLFCYTGDPRPVIAELDRQAGLRYLHRPANLEDVFLKLTGRDLRD